MTIGAWVGLIVTLVFILLFAVGILAAVEAPKTAWVITLAIVLVVSVGFSGLFIWYRNTSESGKRALKNQKSNLTGGIERTVSVYDINGDLIKEYSGKFDIDTDRSSYILFDDEEGNRHVVYYTTGTIIIDEK